MNYCIILSILIIIYYSQFHIIYLHFVRVGTVSHKLTSLSLNVWYVLSGPTARDAAVAWVFIYNIYLVP